MFGNELHLYFCSFNKMSLSLFCLLGSTKMNDCRNSVLNRFVVTILLLLTVLFIHLSLKMSGYLSWVEVLCWITWTMLWVCFFRMCSLYCEISARHFIPPSISSLHCPDSPSFSHTTLFSTWMPKYIPTSGCLFRWKTNLTVSCGTMWLEIHYVRWLASYVEA